MPDFVSTLSTGLPVSMAVLMVIAGAALAFGGAWWADIRRARGRSGPGGLPAVIIILLGTFLALVGVYLGIVENHFSTGLAALDFASTVRSTTTPCADRQLRLHHQNYGFAYCLRRAGCVT